MRYGAKYCSNNGGLYWRERILGENQNYGLSIDEILDKEIKGADKSPWTESNFLRKSFYEGLKRAGLLS